MLRYLWLRPEIPRNQALCQKPAKLVCQICAKLKHLHNEPETIEIKWHKMTLLIIV